MATADQIKALLRSYAEGDGEQFLTVSMQVAAPAARKGQSRLAQELRELIDEAKRRASQPISHATVPIARPLGELADLIHASYPKTRLVDMILTEPGRQSLARVLTEYRQQDKLRLHGMSARRKLLMVGPLGSGKTMTAALAGELKLPLLGVRLDVRGENEENRGVHTELDAPAPICLEVRSKPGFKLNLDSLENRDKGIEVSIVRQEGDVQVAAIHIPDGALTHFLKRVEEYLAAETRKVNPKHNDLIARIDGVRLATIQTLWEDDSEFPPKDQAIWWEVWVRAQGRR